MANALYPLWKQALMRELDTNKSLDQSGANGSYLSLVSIGAGGYTYSSAHQYYTSVTGVVNVAKEVTNPVVNGSVFKGDALVFVNVTGSEIGALILTRQNAGPNSSWRLVLYEDTGIIGLPMIPNGGNLLVTWNAAGIFGLGSAT